MRVYVLKAKLKTADLTIPLGLAVTSPYDIDIGIKIRTLH